MEFNTKIYDEAAVKHALHTRHVAIVGRYDDDIAKVIIPLDENEYVKAEFKKQLQKLSCKEAAMSFRGIPRDKDGKPLVVQASEPLKKEELSALVEILGNGNPN